MLDTDSVGIWNNSVYSRTKKKTMNKSQLRELVREVIRGGRSDYYPGVETPGLTPDVFNSILKNVALGKKYSEEENSEKEKIRRGNLLMNKGNVKTGNDILDRGNPNIRLEEAEETLSASEIKEFVKQTLNLEDYDVAVRLYPNHKEIKLTIKQDPSVEDFNTVIEYLQDNGYTIDHKQTTREGDNDGDRYYYPRIIFR